ncbi:uncharacterized protein [Musca autumnalis]|uniref:uncharacterized protein n=1 Tax=Musca autumnalis TaxID=221902 RepID=UPI003CEF427C
MTSALGFYKKPKLLHSPSFDDDEDGLFANDEDDEYLQEVPYTSSSSIDRGSIGSIPWNDDATRLNQLEWEKVENMLAGIENLPADEDLRKEILDWQKKFPKLVGRKGSPYRVKSLRSDTLESLPSLNLSSSDEAEMDDDITLSRDKVNKHEDAIAVPHSHFRQPYRKSSDESNEINSLLQNFTLTTVPLKLNERENMQNPGNKRKCATSSSSSYTPPTPTNVPIVQPSSQHRLRMPPILNVLESTRKFRNLGRHQVNPSFVQLTHVQQAKSAVISQEQNSRSRINTGHRSAWHVPLAANRFFHNRNSIVLPSISSRQQQQQVIQYNSQPTTISNSSDVNTTPSSTREHFIRTNANTFKSNPITTRRDRFSDPSTAASSTQTTNNTSNSGRSISAAVSYHPRSTFNVFYLPYSASKFHAFK